MLRHLPLHACGFPRANYFQLCDEVSNDWFLSALPLQLIADAHRDDVLLMRAGPTAICVKCSSSYDIGSSEPGALVCYQLIFRRWLEWRQDFACR